MAPTDTHDSRGAARQVHPWAHDLKAAVAKIAVSPVVPKAVAASAADSMAHRHGAVSIENVSPVRPKVVGLNGSALNVDPNVVDSNANDLPVHHTDAVTIAIVTRVARKENDMNANGSPVLRADMEWIATASQDLLANMVSIAIASPVRPNVVGSMVLVRHVRHSMHV
jgi:hypothetical protein